MYIIKYIWFNLHTIGMYILPFIWIYFPQIVWFYFIVILSWKLNDDKCLITELEYYLFNETFLGKGKTFFVPRTHRYILYLNTILCILLL